MRTTITTFKRKFTSLLQTNPGLAIFSSMALGVFISGFLLFSFTYLLPNPQVAIAKENQSQNQVSQTVGVSASSKTSTRKPVLEVHVANTGMTYIQGAKVLSVSSNTLVVQTVWNKVWLQWTIHTNESYYESRHFGTNFLDVKGKNISIMDIKIGDMVTISGDMDTQGEGLTIKADVVRRLY